MPIRMLVAYSFSGNTATVQAIRSLGSGELTMSQIRELLQVSLLYLVQFLVLSRLQQGETHAKGMFTALNHKLKEEDLRRNQKARDRFARRL